MKERHAIMKDREFWQRLEFNMPLCPEQKNPRYWIDGFLPETIQDTSFGVIASGDVWIVDGQEQMLFQFEAEIPQKRLHKRAGELEFVRIRLDVEGRMLSFSIK